MHLRFIMENFSPSHSHRKRLFRYILDSFRATPGMWVEGQSWYINHVQEA